MKGGLLVLLKGNTGLKQRERERENESENKGAEAIVKTSNREYNQRFFFQYF
jgi:hypothetical protein